MLIYNKNVVYTNIESPHKQLKMNSKRCF